MMNDALPNNPAALKDLLLKRQRTHLARTVLLQSRMENMAAQTSAFQVRIEMLEQAFREWEARKQAVESPQCPVRPTPDGTPAEE